MSRKQDSDQPEPPETRGRTSAQKGAEAREQMRGTKASGRYAPYRKSYPRSNAGLRDAEAAIDSMLKRNRGGM